MNMKLR